MEENNLESDKFRRIRIPKQDFKNIRPILRPLLSKEMNENLRKVFDLFAEEDKVNPYHIKDGLRAVSKCLN
jgi:hypothetical protein